jgi:hypothetical protein
VFDSDLSIIISFFFTANRFKFLGSITLDGNFMVGRVSNHVCDLRNYQLSVFVVGCPSVLGDSQTVVGIICNIPDCCTECI